MLLQLRINRISVLTSSVVDRGFKLRSGQTKDYKIGICCFSAKHAALRRKSKDWLAQNQDNLSIRGLLFQRARTTTRCVGTTWMSPQWILRRLANVSPFFNSLINRLRIRNEFQSWSVTYDYTLSYQKSSQYLKS